MRVAHLSPDLGPIDFCYRGALAGTFVGPVLSAGSRATGGGPPSKDAGSSSDAGAALEASSPSEEAGTEEAGARPSLSYRSVSNYRNLEVAGPIRIAIVEAGATSCANPIATAEATLDPGKLATIAIMPPLGVGDAAAPVDIVKLSDDRTTNPASARVRVIHAAVGSGEAQTRGSGPLAVRVVATKTSTVADRVEPRRAASESPAIAVDALGYATLAPFPSPASIAIGPAATDGGADAGFSPWQSGASDLELRGDSLHTAFVLTDRSPHASLATAAWFEVLWCADTTTSGDQTACVVIR
jgi:hypothetical protein